VTTDQVRQRAERDESVDMRADDDPLKGIPAEVIAVGDPYDTDTAGGCG
jgi:hypothetical protein